MHHCTKVQLGREIPQPYLLIMVAIGCISATHVTFDESEVSNSIT